MCARSYSIIRSLISRQRRATGDWWTRQPRGLYFPQISLEDVSRAQRHRAIDADFRGAYSNHEKSGFHAIIGDAVPHHSRLASSNGMLERDHLAGVQRGIRVNGAESALAVIQQAANDFLRRGIVERKLERTLAAVTALGRRSAAAM